MYNFTIYDCGSFLIIRTQESYILVFINQGEIHILQQTELRVLTKESTRVIHSYPDDDTFRHSWKVLLCPFSGYPYFLIPTKTTLIFYHHRLILLFLEFQINGIIQ